METEKIKYAVKSFTGLPLSEITSEKILTKIRQNLNNELFDKKVTIDGNVVTVGDLVINMSVSV